jgi:hypothetical protein
MTNQTTPESRWTDILVHAEIILKQLGDNTPKSFEVNLNDARTGSPFSGGFLFGDIFKKRKAGGAYVDGGERNFEGTCLSSSPQFIGRPMSPLPSEICHLQDLKMVIHKKEFLFI